MSCVFRVMHIFYTPYINGDTHLLDEQESKHAIRVLRLARGDDVVLVDGTGGWYEAVILEDHSKRCILRIESHTAEYQPLPYYLHLAVSPTKNMDRFEWFLEKATELGISEITPLLCQRTERKQVKMERLQKIIVSAMKQSLRAYKPALNEPEQFKNFISGKRPGVKGIAHCYTTGRRDLTDLGQDGSYTILIGPEGDFSQPEVEMALDNGYVPVQLGTSRLRTETAAIYLTAAIHYLHPVPAPGTFLSEF